MNQRNNQLTLNHQTNSLHNKKKNLKKNPIKKEKKWKKTKIERVEEDLVGEEGHHYCLGGCLLILFILPICSFENLRTIYGCFTTCSS